MEQLNLNNILKREDIYNNIKNILINFEKNKKNIQIKRGIYLYGSPGSGKSKFIYNLLRDLNYDIILYDAGEIRNKSVIDTITQHNMSDRNVLSIFKKKTNPLAIIMDEIDGMNNGDKGGINSLIKIIRPKKTKKQKQEELSHLPIICIGNYHIDKKIKELIKVCHTFEFNTPSDNEIKYIVKKIFPSISNNNLILENAVTYIQNDLRKLTGLYNISINNNSIFENENVLNIFKPKSFNEHSKNTTKNLINNYYNISDHNIMINETDRTIIGLLWHENIIECFNKIPNTISIPLYIKLLENICYADYIDRITFQKQIWQFNEMSSLIKIFYNNYIYHNCNNNLYKYKIQNIRFTKVLTKYSTEYNNYLFIQQLCQNLNLDKKDLLSFFTKIRDNYVNNEFYSLIDNYDLTKLDINRIYRYIDKYTSSTGTNHIINDIDDINDINDINDIYD